MKKITALFLATLMVALCFSVVSVATAEDTNLLAGMTYTVGGEATPDENYGAVDTTPASVLTDGVVRTPAEMTSSGIPVAGKTLEYSGTYKSVSFTFEFDDVVSVASVVVDGARGWDVLNNEVGETAPNRHCNIAKIEVSSNGLDFVEATCTVTKEAIAEAAQYGTTAPADQYWTITATLDTVATDVAALRVTLDTTRGDGSNGFIVQLDEIEAYGTASAPVESSENPIESSEVPVESSETPVESSEESEESSESSEENVTVADTTYTVYLAYDSTGAVLMVVEIPEGIASGNLVFNVSEDLVLVDIINLVGGAVNTEYEDGIMINFASMSEYPAETVVAMAELCLVDGATLDADDIIIVDYELSGTSDIISTMADGTCEIVLVDLDEEFPDDTSEETSDETSDVTSDDITEETTSEDTTAEDTTAEDTTVEDTTVEETSEESEGDAPATGDSGIAVFAVLALVSAAAVVILKKRA